MDSGNTFYPNEIIIDMSVTWTRTGNVYSNGVTANEAEPVSSINHLNDYMMFTPQLLGIE